MYIKAFKPLFDFIISLLVLIILSPVILILSLLIYLKLGKPILFSQERPGKNEKLFRLYKFRTMSDTRDSNGDLLPDVNRLTEFSSFIRKTSLDELPQLFNVLKGDISLVGPRPLLAEYLPLYDQDQKKRHLVKPGITGWAQINGRNSITWNDKFEFDIYYVYNISFFLDLKIVFKTLFRVIRGSGINSPDGNTMPKFSGNNQ
jgi:undecaprenyl phosphate N,N'-diacetylbacillosamine 1-phosphate transferase